LLPLRPRPRYDLSPVRITSPPTGGRDDDAPVRLTFELPATLALRAPRGRYTPCLAGCRLDVDQRGWVRIGAVDRWQARSQALRFLRGISQAGDVHQEIIALWRHREPHARGSDSGIIVIGDVIAFASGLLDVYPRVVDEKLRDAPGPPHLLGPAEGRPGSG
jgi:hypothetical protein